MLADNQNRANLIADLLFAYIGKDEDFPHQFEVNAFENALCFLQEHYSGKKYDLKMFENHLAKMMDCLGE